MRVVVMGVTGSGKSVVGRELAVRGGWPFLDGDDFHSPQARQQMELGEGLTDEGRLPWLALLRRELETRADVVLACSALRRRDRDALRVGQVAFVFLNVPQPLLRERLTARSGHYAGPSLLPSQLATLEVPGQGERDVVTLNVGAADTPADLAQRALETLGAAHA